MGFGKYDGVNALESCIKESVFVWMVNTYRLYLIFVVLYRLYPFSLLHDVTYVQFEGQTYKKSWVWGRANIKGRIKDKIGLSDNKQR